MPSWWYFNRPVHSAFHDLTTSIRPPLHLRSLLGLGHKFCPVPRFTNHNLEPTLERFGRNLRVKSFFAGAEDRDFDPKMYINTDWEPQSWQVATEVKRRLRDFSGAIAPIFRKRRGRSNLLSHQLRALRALASSKELIVLLCDKNLGPAVIETSVYIRRCLDDHLLDESTYRRLTQRAADTRRRMVLNQIDSFIDKWKESLGPEARKYLRHHLGASTAFPVFYATIKIHKDPWTLRPIVSCSGSMLYALGVWVDTQLQIVATAQRSYFKSSAVLKDQLLRLELPPGAKLFKADAVSMYTNIPTRPAMHDIAAYLRSHAAEFPTINVPALIEALRLVMLNNVFTFGDTYWLQVSGTAMGTPPAPPYATLFYAIHEERSILPAFGDNLFFYRRFIDDVIGIWRPSTWRVDDAANWARLQDVMNSHRGMRWEFSDRCDSIDYMDMQLSIVNGSIVTGLFEKALNLYLYIPPHSAHPPGVLTGLVLGNAHRIYTLCSDPADVRRHLRDLYHRLRVRGHSPGTLLPLFERAAVLHRERLSGSSAARAPTNLRKTIFFHLQHHPGDPPSRDLQQIFSDRISAPPYGRPLAQVRNRDGFRIGIDRMIVAYSRPRNLGNLLSSRVLDERKGPLVSSYVD